VETVETKSIKFKSGYKYQLVESYSVMTPLRPVMDIAVPFIRLLKTGLLEIDAGYAWDGPSGPTIDTGTFMRGSLVHDALYQLIRMELLSMSKRAVADQMLHDICVEDGMCKVRAWYVLKAMAFTKSAASPKNIKPVLTTP
jgi:hypothetical protein